MLLVAFKSVFMARALQVSQKQMCLKFSTCLDVCKKIHTEYGILFSLVLYYVFHLSMTL